jgi:hypothetical protein
MTIENAAHAAVIDVSDLAQLLVCEACTARPDKPFRVSYLDVSLVLHSVRDRMPRDRRALDALLSRALGLAYAAARRAA